MKNWRHFEKPDTRRNMPVINEKPPPVSVQGIFKKAQSLRQKIKPAKTVQQIFQEAKKSSEKLKQKAPLRVQNALPSGASFFILTIILIFGVAGIAALLAPILVPIVILCAIAGMSFNDD